MKRLLRQVMEQSNQKPICVQPEATVEAAVAVMRFFHVNSLVVVDDEGLCGIFTAHDVLFRVVEARLDPRTTWVGDVMTRDVVTAPIDTPVGDAIAMMIHSGYRHLPVVDGTRIVGVASIGRLVRSMASELERHAEDLARYIGGPAVIDAKPFAAGGAAIRAIARENRRGLTTA